MITLLCKSCTIRVWCSLVALVWFTPTTSAQVYLADTIISRKFLVDTLYVSGVVTFEEGIFLTETSYIEVTTPAHISIRHFSTPNEGVAIGSLDMRQHKGSIGRAHILFEADPEFPNLQLNRLGIANFQHYETDSLNIDTLAVCKMINFASIAIDTLLINENKYVVAEEFSNLTLNTRGALEIESSDSIKIASATFYENTAQGFGAAVFVRNSNYFELDNWTSYNNSAADSLLIIDSINGTFRLGIGTRGGAIARIINANKVIIKNGLSFRDKTTWNLAVTADTSIIENVLFIEGSAPFMSTLLSPTQSPLATANYVSILNPDELGISLYTNLKFKNSVINIDWNNSTRIRYFQAFGPGSSISYENCALSTLCRSECLNSFYPGDSLFPRFPPDYIFNRDEVLARYSPDSASVLVDRGAAIPGLNTDLLGNPRISGSAPDIGAIEFQYAPTAIAEPRIPRVVDWLYPNPARDAWTLRPEAQVRVARITIIGMGNGQRTEMTAWTGHQIATAPLAPGAYLAVMYDRSGVPIAQQRVMILR